MGAAEFTTIILNATKKGTIFQPMDRVYLDEDSGRLAHYLLDLSMVLFPSMIFLRSAGMLLGN